MGDSLEHYGVKGMKWGVRRTPEQLGHRSASEKPYRKTSKKLIEKGAKLKTELARDVLGRQVTRSQVIPRNQQSSAVNLKAGSKIQHISGVNFDKLKSGQLYVTSNPQDNDMYSAFLGSKLKRAGFNPKAVVMDLKVDLKAPSSKEQYSIFDKFLSKNQEQVEKDVHDWLIEKGKDPVVSASKKDLYDQFINAAERSSSSQKAFYNELRKRGYNAVLDEHDITGSWMQSQQPLIIMDTLSTIGNFKVSDLSVKDMQDALDRLIKS